MCVLCAGAGAGPGPRRVDRPTRRLSESVPCCPPPLYRSPVNRYPGPPHRSRWRVRIRITLKLDVISISFSECCKIRCFTRY
jgi:hypothetical protein